jgi:ribosomal protein S18 acetylase RimI-like enzyme
MPRTEESENLGGRERPPGELVRLKREHQESVLAFLEASPIENVMVIDRIREDGLPGRAYQEFVGWRAGDAWLAVAFFSGDIAIYAPTGEGVEAIAHYALRRVPLVPRIISRRETVDAFWEVFREAPYPVLFDRRQLVYTLAPADLRDAPEPAMRAATLDQLDEVARLASAMSYEEIQMDPLRDHPIGYRRLIEQRIRMGRYWVLVEDGRIRFQVHLNSVTPQAGQITGVYTPPEFRGRGYARRGMGAFCRAALAQAPLLCLFVNDFNTAARRLYEGVGFKPCMEYRAIFLDA